MKNQKIGMILLASLLAACGSGDGADDTDSSTRLISDLLCTDASGILAGHYLGDDNSIASITPGGLALVYDRANEAVHAGCVRRSGSTLSGRLGIYPDGVREARGTLAATIDSSVANAPVLTGTLTVEGTAHPFKESYQLALSRQTASVSGMAGSYTDSFSTATITADGKLTLTDGASSCSLSSTLTAPDANLNLYALSRIKITCGSTSTENAATGLAARDNVGALYVIWAGNNYAGVYYLPAAAAPSP